MNTKRQTIWLVSMLSLMVVLSAYYLFTEDVGKLNVASDKANTEDIKVTTETADPQGGEKAVTGTATGTEKSADAKGNAGKSATADGKAAGTNASGTNSGDAKAADSKAADSKASDSKAADAKSAGAKSGEKTSSTQTGDAKVLEKLQASASSGADYFAAQYMKRNDELAKQTDKFIDILSDTKQSPDAIAKATEELDKIQTKQAKVENIEDILAKDYNNAIVLEEGNKFRVVVQADKLERSQAQTIIDLVLKELDVAKDQISVQFMR